MHEKRIGEPCPQCATALQRRRSTFRTVRGDVAYCARCNAAFELAAQDQAIAEAAGFGVLATLEC